MNEMENKNWANPPKDSSVSSDSETLSQSQREPVQTGGFPVLHKSYHQ